MIKKRIVMRFPRRLVDQPIASNLARTYDLEFNILRASITPDEEGLLVLEIKGTEADCTNGENYLAELGIDIRPLSHEVIRDETRCTHCGACTSVCPTDALRVDRRTMEVVFDEGKCIACEFCIPACPTRAMAADF